MIFGMIMLMTFGLVDTFFVGLLGTEELAAISFTFPVTFTLISLNIGLGIGTSATIARYLGSGQDHLAKEFATGALMLSFIMVGTLAIIGELTIEPVFRLLGATEEHMPHIKDYMYVWYAAGVFLALPMVGNSVLRASGDTKTPSMVMAMGGFVNAALDPILIFGWGPIPAMGIQGAAVATLIAWLAGMFYILYLLAIKRKLMLPRLLTWQEMKLTSRGILKIGLPAAGANMLTPIAGGVMTAIVATYGSEAVAAWGVGSRLESIASIIILALSMTLPPFISQNFGAQKMHRVEDAYKLCIKFVLVWQVIVYLLFMLTSSWIAMAFAEEADVAQLITLFLFIVPIGYGFQGVIILTNSSFNAIHQPMSALILSIIRLFIFFVPVAYLGSLLFGLEGLFGGAVLANVLTALVAYLWFKRALKLSQNEANMTNALEGERS
ncbi:MATE family efflux transporter [Aestuariibacter sp. AA17]|uniref:MATE family efflux transporter n=2 Tax=Fluctibacter corallii TaxID=2984329 RepID=A0ABT3AAD5_9ALTE|nr:MATE family efflux transporter [Aestuariibacter sp. AA17]MCV2885619.1 MATE family efflux transporter [Aestuariibacter sp. AA17]